MFFIFGWGRQTSTDHGLTLPLKCPNCNNSTFFHLVQLRKWFTLFFVPVIPYESGHYLLCPVCTRGLQLEPDRVEAAKYLNETTRQFHAKQITEDQYREALESTILFDVVVEPSDMGNGDRKELPQERSCRRCGTELILDETEVRTGKFTCPACGELHT